MTPEEKQLLLKDLSARLPYGVKVQEFDDKYGYKLLGIDDDELHIDCPVYDEGDGYVEVDYCKPYLRPMSSMTEEERNELSHYDNSVQRTDFFYSHHIDCRPMIEKGLALEAPEGMYNIKEK